MKVTKTLAMLLVIGTFLSLGGAARAATVFLGGDATDGANWDNGIPAAGNPSAYLLWLVGLIGLAWYTGRRRLNERC